MSGVQFELSEGLTEEMTDRLLRGEIDIALVSAPRPDDHLDYETLVVEQVFVIGPPGDPRFASGTITPKALRSATRRRAAQAQSVPATTPSVFLKAVCRALVADRRILTATRSGPT